MNDVNEPVLELIVYTDPYCTWCWGSEPVLHKIMEVYGGQVRLKSVMGGLVEDSARFKDPLNHIGGPQMAAQVAQHWREAAAAERRFIHRVDVQADLAEEVGLDRERFLAEIASGNAKKAFQANLKLCRDYDVTGFPSYEVHGPGGEEIAMFGYHNFAAFEETFQRLAGDRLKARTIATTDENIVGFARKYGKVAAREVAEVFALKMSDSRERLDRLVSEGKLHKQEAGSGWLYMTV